METYKTQMRTKGTRMGRFQDEMFLGVDAGDPLGGGWAPGEEDHAHRPGFGYCVDDLLREFLPTFAGMAVGLVSAHREARIQQEDTTVSPWCE